jgi:hypothetical protein
MWEHVAAVRRQMIVGREINNRETSRRGRLRNLEHGRSKELRERHACCIRTMVKCALFLKGAYLRVE